MRGLCWLCVFAAAVGVVEAFGVGAEGFQAEFGAKIDRAALVFGLMEVLRGNRHLAPTHQAGRCCWLSGDCFCGLAAVFPAAGQVGSLPGRVWLPVYPTAIQRVLAF